jgi:hypothetical protein
LTPRDHVRILAWPYFRRGGGNERGDRFADIDHLCRKAVQSATTIVIAGIEGTRLCLHQ